MQGQAGPQTVQAIAAHVQHQVLQDQVLQNLQEEEEQLTAKFRGTTDSKV